LSNKYPAILDVDMVEYSPSVWETAVQFPVESRFNANWRGYPGKIFFARINFRAFIKKNFFRVYTIYFHTCLVL